MNKIFYLITCTTGAEMFEQVQAKKFIDQYQPQMIEIKSQGISPGQVDEMQALAGSYEALFSRRALKYKALGLKDKSLAEQDYRRYIIEEYTFLKRPVFIINNKIFIGSEKKNIQALKHEIEKLLK